MDFPIVGVAYRATKEGDAIIFEEILLKEIDHINFLNRIKDPKTRVKYRELTEQERYHLDPLSFVREPTTSPATKKTNRLAAKIQKFGSWIISSIWTIIITVIATMLAAYLLVKFAIPH